MTDYIVKWNDTTGQLTAYCNDDKTDTEIGPVKWSDTNNRLELHCDGGVYPVEWNDATGQLEAQGVGDGCCCACLICPVHNPPSDGCETTYSITVNFPGGCTGGSGTFTLTFTPRSFRRWKAGGGPNPTDNETRVRCFGGRWLLQDARVGFLRWSGTINACGCCPIGSYIVECVAGGTGTAVIS